MKAKQGLAQVSAQHPGELVMDAPALDGEILGPHVSMLRGQRANPREGGADGFLRLGEVTDHVLVGGVLVPLLDLGAVEMGGQLALGGLAQSADALGEVVLSDEVI